MVSRNSHSQRMPRGMAALSPVAAMLQSAGMGLMLLAVSGAPASVSAAEAAGVAAAADAR